MPRNRRHHHNHSDDDLHDSDLDDGYDAKAHPKLRKKNGASNEDQDTIERLIVEPSMHRYLIGQRGSVKKDLEAKHDVVIDIPSKGASGSDADKVYVNGRERNVRDAIAEMRNILARQTAKAAVALETECFSALQGQEQVSIAVDFEKSAHGAFVGKQHSRLTDLRQRLRTKEGAVAASTQEVGVEVLLPSENDTTSIITVKVPKFVCERAMRVIKEFVSFYELDQFLRSLTVVDTDTSQAMKGSGGGQGRGQKAKATGNRAAAAAAAAPAAKSSAPAAASASTAASSSTAAAAAAAAVDASQSRPARVFPDFVDLAPEKYDRHKVLECRFG